MLSTKWTPSRLRTALPILTSGLIGAVVGAIAIGGARSGLRADDRGAGGHRPDAGVKAPIAEVMHCPLAFAGVHLLKEFPTIGGRLSLLQEPER